jgi:hypothetical protein
MDILILSNALNLPIILISNNKMAYNGKKYFVMNSNVENKYFILKILISKEKIYPEYRLIVDEKGIKNINTEEILFQDNESDTRESLKDVVADGLITDIKRYLDSYKIKKKKLILVK